VSDGLDVVVVSYRSRALLRRCLASLAAHPPARPMRVIVVDNDSRDGTVELVRSEFPHVEVVTLGGNVGFAAAINVGIRRSSAPFVLALNPDTEVQDGVLDRVLDVAERRPEVGIVGCRLVRADGRFDHASSRRFPSPLGALGHFLPLGDRLRRGPLDRYRLPEHRGGPVDAVNGAFMLLRRDALDEVGAFDEGYWMYMEDLDLCRRFAEAGWSTWYEPGATVRHLKGGTTGGRRSVRLLYAFHYGMFRFYRRHEAPRRSAPVNAAVYAGIAARLAVTSAAAAVSSVIGFRRGRSVGTP
jgi:GT2 family glycosyltransferase